MVFCGKDQPYAAMHLFQNISQALFFVRLRSAWSGPCLEQKQSHVRLFLPLSHGIDESALHHAAALAAAVSFFGQEIIPWHHHETLNIDSNYVVVCVVILNVSSLLLHHPLVSNL